ncbi:putative polyketide synthase [Pseudomassariella vexata]|uniref:Putative polyketide synthase n=1 Tax=Pseudomassariella vexata TaxID=1141098 RepID=A0A1Y2EJE2_9PEZI|nr:putative polyketide synthase [Pseudomassariella vexata]ORY71434.1 putative polyketide synthase [Pseudomassariella vexata]
MVGLVNSQASTPSSFLGASTPTSFSANTNGHGLNGKVHANGNGYVNGNGHSSINGQSLNGDSFTSIDNNETTENFAAEPIAIIGMGCRLPGKSSSCSKLWDLLIAGRSAQGPFPTSRFNIDGFYHPNGERPGSLNTAGGYFIDEDIRAFENSFFGINNLEATFMDPQQRKLLEVVFECFESAGLTLEQLSGANVGCYVGNFVTDFITMQLKDSEYTHRYTATGLGTTILANRISHVFNLKGPSFVIDTACSSSLYCLHAACSALLSRDCDSAVVAGANLIQSPEQQLATMKAGVLSKTSTCHTFDSSADGYGRADGIGALMVKRLSDAIRDGDPVRAVIRGTAVNSNGRTNGITLPSADGQEAVIRKAYAQAGLGYNETDYVECHGTGTAVGDPIEVEATSRVFKRPQYSPPLLVGSVKTNLGHSEAASGISSIIKVVLALETGKIPATVGVKNINPKIKLDKWNIKIVTETTAWPSNSPHNVDQQVRRAGVNSFGYGGANSHVIIDAASMHVPSDYMLRSPEEKSTALARTTMFLPVSANNNTALKHRVSDLSLLDLPNVNTVDLAYTLGVRRSHLPVRGYLLARPGHLKEDLMLEKLQTRIDGKAYSKLPLAFVFTGQGAQWAEMGRELLAEFPIFRRTIQMLDSKLQLLPHPPTWTLLGTLLESAETSMINHASRSQPICTAIQVGLVKLLSAFGIKPAYVLGHSSGEIAAAYAAGYVTAEEAIAIAYYRGYTVTRSSKAIVGAMMAVGLGRAEANDKINSLGLGNKINVACVNSPESVTISGDVDGIQELMAHLDSEGVFARQLKTDGKAYHSRHMVALGEEYEDYLVSAASAVDSRESSSSTRDATWISSVNGEVVERDTLSLAYWRANLESPVLFETVVGKLLRDVGPHHLVEIGPHSALQMPIKQTCSKLNIGKDKVHYGTALSRGKNSVATVLSLVGDLYLHDHTISFEEVNMVGSWPLKTNTNLMVQPRQGAMLVDLPKYYWDYDPQQKLFQESRTSVEWRNRKYLRHDLLGSQVHGGNGIMTTWRNVLKAKDVPWIEGHKLDTTTVVPAAGYLAVAIEAMTQAKYVRNAAAQGVAFKLQDVHITKALVLPQEDGLDTGVELFTTLQPAQLTGRGKSEWHHFSISSYVLGEATTHATGFIKLVVDLEHETAVKSSAVKHEDMEPTAPRTWYKQFAEGGLNFQGSFQSLTQVHVPAKRQEMKILASTEILQGSGSGTNLESTYTVHPVTIDAVFQAGIIASTSGVVRELQAKVPVHIEQMTVRPPQPGKLTVSPLELNVKAVSEPVGFGTIRVSGELYDAEGSSFLQINGCRLVAYQSGMQQQDQEERHPMLRVLWKPDITKLGTSNGAELSSYIKQYVARAQSAAEHQHQDALVRLGAVVDLLAHKEPRLRILTFLADDTEESYLAETLRFATAFKRCQSLWRGSYTDDGLLQFQEYSSGAKPSSDRRDLAFDVVLFGPHNATQSVANLAAIKDLIASDGALVCLGSADQASKLETEGFELPLQSQLGGQYETIFARLSGQASSEEKGVKSVGEVLIVERSPEHSLNAALVAKINIATGRPVHRVALDQITADLVQAHANVIATVELEDALLSCVTEDEMRFVKILTDNCANLIWVTGGQLLQGLRPEMGIVFGLSRALMLEQPSLRFFVVDVDVDASSPSSEIETTAAHVIDVLAQAVNDLEPDFEFIHTAGSLHVSRFIPAESLNSTFREKLGAEKRSLALGQAQPCRLDVETVGQTDSIFFRQEEPAAETSLAADHVEVSVKAVGLNARDLQSISGNAETSSDTTCTSQYAGVITRVGTDVKTLVPGDRVVSMARGYFATHEHAAESACHKLNDDEDFKTMASLPLPLSTAIYAIHDRARLEANESILVVCDSNENDAVAEFAAIRIAQQVGAQVFAICASTKRQEKLLQDLKLPQDHVFKANDANLGARIAQATGHRGVDVIVSFTDDGLPADMSASTNIGAICGGCARLVQVGSGGSGLADALVIDPTVLRRNITLSTFDIGSLIARPTPQGQSLRRRLLADAIALYRGGDLDGIAFPPRVWDISDVKETFRALASKKEETHHHGGAVVSLEDKESAIPVMPIKYDTKMSPEKTYLLIGCLGGLGRSMSKWMLSRGVRKFVFMGRSGTDKAPARRLVENLQSLGAEVTVVRGDVVNVKDVNRAVADIHGPIGGVIQAAMGLDEALFTTMPRDYWLAGLRPKVVGSWNLRNALAGREKDLDFFLMTSSVSGSVGTATESNYCSANYFLDMFARYCRNVGIPAVSVGLGMISEVGYLHENPEIEALLLRKGIQAINEDEMLHIIDIALSTRTTTQTGAGDLYDSFAQGHVLTGLEPLGLKALRAQGFEGTSPVLGDPRAFLLSAALDETTSGTGASGTTNGLPAEVAEAIEAGSSAEEAILSTVCQKFSSLVLIPKDKLDVTKPISSVGVDSMLAAEFRAWIFQAFKTDVPYLTLLSPAATLTMLSDLVTQKITEAK